MNHEETRVWKNCWSFWRVRNSPSFTVFIAVLRWTLSWGTLWCKVLPGKPTSSRLVTKLSFFVELGGTLPHSRRHCAGSFPEPDKSSSPPPPPHPPPPQRLPPKTTVFKLCCSITLSYTPVSPKTLYQNFVRSFIFHLPSNSFLILWF